VGEAAELAAGETPLDLKTGIATLAHWHCIAMTTTCKKDDLFARSGQVVHL
jgi:hypothetical protein